MNKLAITTTIIAGILFTSANAMADSKSYRGNHAKLPFISGVSTSSIEKRMAQGVKRGQLTRTETRRLQSSLNSLKATLRAVYKDGKVTSREKRQAQQKDNKLNRELTKLINNKVTTRNRR